MKTGDIKPVRKTHWDGILKKFKKVKKLRINKNKNWKIRW